MNNDTKFSLTTSGILLTIAGPLIAHFGFSQQCSGEISSVLVPALAALPGAIVAQIGRWKAGGVTPLGFRKPRY